MCAGGVVVPRERRVAGVASAVVALGLSTALLVMWTVPAAAVVVDDEAAFRAAWSNPAETRIDLATDITLTCAGGPAQRNSPTPLTLDGHGHSITPTCPERSGVVVLGNTSAAGSSPVVFRNVTINRGIATGPVSLTNSLIVGNAPNSVHQVIGVEVRRKHKPRGHEPRRHQPQGQRP